MPLFVSQHTLKEAVERLAIAAVSSSLADYFIFKRALVIMRDAARETGDIAPNSVVTGMKSAPFVQAIEEMSLRVPTNPAIDEIENPYYIPFGSKRDNTRGYRTKKFPSNGSSDTVGRWQSRSNRPLVLVPDTSPKEFAIETRTKYELESFFLVKGAAENFSGETPRLLDAAIWWFRFLDLEVRFSSEPTTGQLESAFVSDLDISVDERSALFSQVTVEDVLPDGNPGTSNGTGNIMFARELADPIDYLPPAPQERSSVSSAKLQRPNTPLPSAGDELQTPMDDVIAYLSASGFVFEPWQVASFITAVRTKPFVILAGISGTGKTKLPRLVANATDSVIQTVPVRPDWTDSSDLLGFQRLDGTFYPGSLLRFARRANENPDQQFFFVLDEMNIARVEYYLAEVLSRIEERFQSDDGRSGSEPLVPEAEEGWGTVGLPENLCIVGSVNMDETTFGFSRKVLDRAFVIEFSSIDLSAIGESNAASLAPRTWPVSEWRTRSASLSSHPDRGSADVAQMIETLTRINAILERAQLQFGYRVRDEIVLFCLAAQQCVTSFTTSNSGTVDPLDVAVAMKVLPRIQGSGEALKNVLTGLLAWASPDSSSSTMETGSDEHKGFPFCADRLQLMQRRLSTSGYTSFWL